MLGYLELQDKDTLINPSDNFGWVTRNHYVCRYIFCHYTSETNYRVLSNFATFKYNRLACQPNPCSNLNGFDYLIAIKNVLFALKTMKVRIHQGATAD